MSKSAAMRAVRKTMLSGYHHHSRIDTRGMMDAAIEGRDISALTGILNLETYADVLAPTRHRAIQNGLICLITVVCRTAIDHGVENELAFALSDYYINEVELQYSRAQLESLTQEMITHYIELVREEEQRTYSQPIIRAIRYINLHLYETCRISDIAEHIGLNTQYFAVLFKKEVSQQPSQYVIQKKLEEAQYLMQYDGMSVTEASEALGYCNSSHFIREYKKHIGTTPKQHIAKQDCRKMTNNERK